jgi:hypothetical protein
MSLTSVLNLPEISRNLGWLLALGVSTGLVTLTATFSVYVDREAAQLPGSYLPASFGAFVFLVSMIIINYFAFTWNGSDTRLLKAVGFTALETGVFIFLLLFLLANVLGS